MLKVQPNISIWEWLTDNLSDNYILSVLSPRLYQYEPNKMKRLKQLANCKDLTLYYCPNMQAKITIRACARFQLMGRQECKECKDRITDREAKSETLSFSERNN